MLVVGLGSIGLRHLENLRTLGCGRLGALRSRNAPMHRDADLSDVKIHDDYDTALVEGYDGVVIANPTSFHLEYAQKAAKAKCHFYIEKPTSHSLDGTAELLREVRRQNLVVTVGCQLRFHPNLIAVKRWLDEQSIGQLLAVQVDTGEYLPDWHPWEDYRNSYAARPELGGGVILTLIHEIDYLYWLLGPLHPVCSFGGTSGALGLDVEDHVVSILMSQASVPVTLHLDYLQRPPCRRLKIVGTRGAIEWDYYRGTATLVVEGESREISKVPQSWERNDLFLGIMADFLDAVCNGHASRVPLDDGVETLRIALELKAQVSRTIE